MRTAQSILIEGGYTVDLANSYGQVQAADVLVENEKIVRLAPHGHIICPTAHRLDATGCLILLGLTNSHTHSPENLAAGFCDGLQLDNWLTAVWGRLDHLSSQEIELVVLFGAAQMLKCGVTAVVDHFRQTPMSLEATPLGSTFWPICFSRQSILLSSRRNAGAALRRSSG